jgi:hypothetical protein
VRQRRTRLLPRRTVHARASVVAQAVDDERMAPRARRELRRPLAAPRTEDIHALHQPADGRERRFVALRALEGAERALALAQWRRIEAAMHAVQRCDDYERDAHTRSM